MNSFKAKHFLEAKTRKDLLAVADKNKISVESTLKKLRYEAELGKLQSEFVNLQKWVA